MRSERLLKTLFIKRTILIQLQQSCCCNNKEELLQHSGVVRVLQTYLYTQRNILLSSGCYCECKQWMSSSIFVLYIRNLNNFSSVCIKFMQWTLCNVFHYSFLGKALGKQLQENIWWIYFIIYQSIWEY